MTELVQALANSGCGAVALRLPFPQSMKSAAHWRKAGSAYLDDHSSMPARAFSIDEAPRMQKTMERIRAWPKSARILTIRRPLSRASGWSRSGIFRIAGFLERSQLDRSAVSIFAVEGAPANASVAARRIGKNAVALMALQEKISTQRLSVGRRDAHHLIDEPGEIKLIGAAQRPEPPRSDVALVRIGDRDMPAWRVTARE